MDRPPDLASAKTWLRNIPGSKRVIKKVLRFDGRALSSDRNQRVRNRGETHTLKKPSKTAAELEASIKVEMEDICDWPPICRFPFSLR